MISLHKYKPIYCDLVLECINKVFTHGTLAYNHELPYWVWLQNQKVHRLRRQHKKITLTGVFNHGCDINLEHSNPIFSLIIFFAGGQLQNYLKFGLFIKDSLVQNNKYSSIIFRLCDLTVTQTLNIESQFFSGTFRLMMVQNNTKFGYKRVSKSIQPTQKKYVCPTLQFSPLKTTRYFPFCRQIIHHTQGEKRSNVATAGQLMWIRTLGQVGSQWY